MASVTIDELAPKQVRPALTSLPSWVRMVELPACFSSIMQRIEVGDYAVRTLLNDRTAGFDPYRYINLLPQDSRNLEQALADGIEPTNSADVPALLSRSFKHLTAGGFAKAIDDAAHAVTLDASNPDALDALAVMLQMSGEWDQAALCHADAARLRPDRAVYLFNLSVVLGKIGNVAAAFELYQSCLQLAPTNVWTSVNILALLAQVGDYAQALNFGEQGLQRGHASAPLYRNLAVAHWMLGKSQEAETALEQALLLEPANSYLQELSRLFKGDLSSPVRGDYIACLYDDLAGLYDYELLTHLNYRVPGTLKKIWDEYANQLTLQGDILDIGCGTGIMALMMRGINASVDGVDVSSYMIDQARAKGIYANLHHADALSYLASSPKTYGAMLLGDVAPYLGSCDDFFGSLAAKLHPGGAILLSVERADGVPLRISRTGRYQHSDEHVRNAAFKHQLSVRHAMADTIRTDNGLPVSGMLYLLVKN